MANHEEAHEHDANYVSPSFAQMNATPAAQTYRITGMDCADCAKSIERGVAKLDGVQTCAINFATGTLKVAGPTPRDAVVQRVQALGYGVQSSQAASSTPPSTPLFAAVTWVEKLPATGVLGFLRFLLSRTNTALAVVGAVLILPGLLFKELLPFLGIGGTWIDVASIAALVIAGLPIVRSAWRTLIINREISINLLMTIAGIGAVAIGAYTEAGLVMVLFAIGEALEGYTSERARDSIRTLMQVAPNEATVLRDSQEQRVAVGDLKLGETIVVKPGERIAMDGQILKGASAVNQAPITGESVPVEKQVSSQVFAGSINGEGALEVKVTQLADDNTISRIIKMVEDAQERKAPAERFVDQFAKYYTPIVVVLAALVAVVPPLLFGAPFWATAAPTSADQGWLYRALELLVVACPCALVISTPVSIISAISNAARNGVLIKGGAYLELLARVNTVAFDKTGTLTEGRPQVIRVRSVNCSNALDTVSGACAPCEDMLALANAVEKRSEHPLAKAILSAAEQEHVDGRYASADDVKAIVGKGVSGRVAGREVLIGSHSYFDQVMPHDPAQCAAISHAASQGQTPMLVGADGAYLGYITVADTARANSRQAVAELKSMGIATAMLTGDNAATAQSIARQVGVDDVAADLMPQDKLTWIQRKTQTQNTRIAMVGDGVNDAPALAAATLGIAMGAGTAQAMETADIALMGNDLSKLPWAIKLARAAMRTIQHNIIFAIGIKVVFFVLVLLGLGSMWMAVLADVGASLLVTLYGMRLAKWKAA